MRRESKYLLCRTCILANPRNPTGYKCFTDMKLRFRKMFCWNRRIASYERD
jgi:hypothetical protein